MTLLLIGNEKMHDVATPSALTSETISRVSVNKDTNNYPNVQIIYKKTLSFLVSSLQQHCKSAAFAFLALYFYTSFVDFNNLA